MSHYAKLATLAFRVVAVVLLGYGLFTSLILARVAAGFGASIMLIPGIATLIVAILLYLASPFLGRLAAAGLAPSAASPDAHST